MKAVYLGSEPMEIKPQEDVFIIPTEELPKFEKWLETHDKQIRAEVWEDIEKIINGMSNPIQTMEIIIEKLKEQNNGV